MKTTLFAFIAILITLFITACGGSKLTPEQIGMIKNRETVYTIIPMWEQKNRIYGTNYKDGNLIPINSPVRILGANSKSIVFEYNGQKKTYYIMQKHSRVDTKTTMARTFSRSPVDLSRFSSDMQVNILTARLSNNMTKDQVVLARGYPPYHRTRSLVENRWKYWNTRRATQYVNFTNGMSVGVAGAYAAPMPIVTTAPVQKSKVYTKLPYTFAHTNASQPNSFVLAIGINKYQQNPDVAYADRSALAFAELANKTMGVPKENIITLTNEQATSGQLKAKVELIKELADNRGNLYIYFAGHGVPGKDGETYILPYDMSADFIHLEPNLRLDKIYAKLAKLKVKKVFVIMDTCFSGKDDDGSLLYKGVAPVLKTKKVKVDNRKITVMTAGKSTDFANDFESKQQRMFTYYLIDELSKGKKDVAAIYPDIQSRVKRSSLMKGLGYKQIPQMYGNTSQKLY